MSSRYRSLRWTNLAACVWAIAFGLPHTWWALGIPAGFPGGEASHQLMMDTWRYISDLVVILLSVLAVVIARALVRPWGTRIPTWLLRSLAWTAAGLLTLRGVAGMLVDGTSDPVWWPTFLIGGILFGIVAWIGRVPSAAAPA